MKWRCYCHFSPEGTVTPAGCRCAAGPLWSAPPDAATAPALWVFLVLSHEIAMFAMAQVWLISRGQQTGWRGKSQDWLEDDQRQLMEGGVCWRSAQLRRSCGGVRPISKLPEGRHNPGSHTAQWAIPTQGCRPPT